MFFKNGIGSTGTRRGKMEIDKVRKETILKLKTLLILKILAENGINLNEFMVSSLYNFNRVDWLIESIYGKLNGIDVVYSIGHEEKGKFCIKEEVTKTTNGHRMDLTNIKVQYYDNVLVISDDEVVYKYELDGRDLLLNGDKTPFKGLNISYTPPTEEEIRMSRQQIHDDIKSSIARSIEAYRGSIEFSKSYYTR